MCDGDQPTLLYANVVYY